MEQKLGRTPVLIVTLLAAAAAYFLRLQQLRTNFENTALLTWFCVIMAAAFAVYALLLRPRKKPSAINGKGLGVCAATLAAAAGLVLSAAAMVLGLESRSDLLMAAGSMVTACCWVVVALQRRRGRELSPVLFMIPALFFAVRLIVDFRNWSRDPMILDYCFDLLTLICVMCATFHLGGFPFARGGRRVTVFFCCCGILFGAAAVAGGRLRELAGTGGAMLWMGANLWPLLRPSRRRRDTEQTQ